MNNDIHDIRDNVSITKSMVDFYNSNQFKSNAVDDLLNIYKHFIYVICNYFSIILYSWFLWKFVRSCWKVKPRKNGMGRTESS